MLFLSESFGLLLFIAIVMIPFVDYFQGTKKQIKRFERAFSSHFDLYKLYRIKRILFKYEMTLFLAEK